AHIKDVAAYLKFVINPRDELAFKRLVQLLPGIGGKGADRLWKAFSAQHGRGVQSLKSKVQSQETPPNREDHRVRGPHSPLVTRHSSLAVRLQACVELVPKKAAVDWAQFAATVAQMEAEDVRRSAAKMIRLALEAGYEDYIKTA